MSCRFAACWLALVACGPAGTASVAAEQAAAPLDLIPADPAAPAAPLFVGTSIVPESSSLCLEAQTDGTVLQEPCDDGLAQRFRFVPSDRGAYAIQTATGGCLGQGPVISGDGGPNSVRPVLVQPCAPNGPGDPQDWGLSLNADGSSSLTGAGKVNLGPENGWSQAGTAIITYDCSAGFTAQELWLAQLDRPITAAKLPDGGAAFPTCD